MIKRFLPYLIIVLSFSTSLKAQKVDTIFHVNGNILTGEIKKMTNGILLFKMEGMGTIKVEVEKINTFKSPKLLQIRTKQGELIFGKIDTSLSKGYVRVGYGVNKKEILIMDIIEVYPIKATFWLRTTGRFDLGFDYTKSTGMLRGNSSGEIEYRKEKSSTTMSWITNASSQKVDTVVVNNQKVDASLTYKHLISGPWLWTGSFGENSNSELGLNLRLFLGFNIQNDIIYTSRHHLFAQVGLNFNREYPVSGSIINNPEAKLSINYNVFKHTTPEIMVTSHVEAYPNLQFNGRWRFDTFLDINVEVFYNFYVGFRVYSNYDSRPADINAQTFDWGSSFTIGYSFN